MKEDEEEDEDKDEDEDEDCLPLRNHLGCLPSSFQPDLQFKLKWFLTDGPMDGQTD